MKKDKTLEIKNKKALHEFTIVKDFCAGVKLLSSEIKSIRNYDVNFNDAYCIFEGKDFLIKNLHISQYKQATYHNHEPLRDRVLLLNKKELEELKRGIEEKGMTIVPIKLFINERGLVKIYISLCRGKKLYDKRVAIKERDIKRETERELR